MVCPRIVDNSWLKVIPQYSTHIQRARFSHNKSQQLHPNNDFDIAVEIGKAPSATIILLLLLLLVPSSSILPYHVGCYCIAAIIEISHSNNILQGKQSNHGTYFTENT